MRRTPRSWAAAALLLVLALSGCGRVTTDITVHADGSYDLTMVMAAAEAGLEAAGQTPESFTSLLQEKLASQPGVEDFVIADYQQDGYAGVEITGENISGDDLGMFGSGVVDTDPDGIHFTLQYPITAVTGTFTQEQAKAVEILTTVTFPGKVTDHNGTLLDEVTVEWTGDGSTDLDYAASSAPAAGAGEVVAQAPDEEAGWALPLALALGGIVIAGVGVWLILRNRADDGHGRPGDHGAAGSGPATSDAVWQPDILGDEWVARTLHLRPDDEGEVVATLVRRAGGPRTGKAVLYVHGFVDYFFQTHMADAFAAHGYDFYALDLRKYGRSLRPYQTPNYVTRLSDYAEELDAAARIIRAEEDHHELVVLGHSTGGLITSLWADARTQPGQRPVIDALVLNSPWFDLNEPWFTRAVATPIIDLLAPLAPHVRVGALAPHYGRALHAATGGEWDYDLTLKPHEGFPVRAGWFRAIRRGHARIARGLTIGCPVLVLTSDASGDAKHWHETITTTDSVLDVAQIRERASRLGAEVTVVTVAGGAHDLTLSPEPARSRFFAEVLGWLAERVEAR